MLALEIVKFVRDYRTAHASADKAEISAATARQFGLVCQRSVYANENVAVRFSTAVGGGFSNTVLSLSALQTYDSRPFLVCLIRPNTVEFFLANSTFLKKLSHSSQAFRVDNLRGSFNGSDILRDYEGTQNVPENLEQLFATHGEFTWEQNIERLVEATNAIAGTGRKFAPTPAQRENILESPSVAHRIANSEEYRQLANQLDAAIQEKAPDILRLAAIDNV